MDQVSLKKYKGSCLRILIISAFFLLVGVISAIIAKSLLYFLTWLVIALLIIIVCFRNFYFVLFYNSIKNKCPLLEGRVEEYDCFHKSASVIIVTNDNKEYETPKYFYASEVIKMVNRNVSFFVYHKTVFINEIITK